MTHVLLTGFDPFDGEAINPSGLAALHLVGEGLPGCTVSSLILPVARFRSIELAVARIERDRPDVVVMLGQAGGRARITPERVALNVDDFRIADNDGNQPDDAPIVPGGPAAFFSGLPVKAMVRAMVAAGVPAEVSNTAGVFVCNHLSYGVLHHVATRRLPVRAGFIHLPYLPEQAATRPGLVPSMMLDLMLTGLRAGVAAAVEVVQPVTVA